MQKLRSIDGVSVWNLIYHPRQGLRTIVVSRCGNYHPRLLTVIQRMADMGSFHLFRFIICSRPDSGRGMSDICSESPPPTETDENFEQNIVFLAIVSVPGRDSSEVSSAPWGSNLLRIGVDKESGIHFILPSRFALQVQTITCPNVASHLNSHHVNH